MDRQGPGSRRLRVAVAAVAVLALLAGCTALESGGHPEGDPASDRLGWENGYWYDDPVNVTASDGYNATEREAVVARTMARVERIRELEFNSTVPVDVISREQYLANRSGGGGNATYSRWNDQVWESIFVVGESSSYSNSSDDTLGQTVQGYYSPGRDAIVLVSDSETPTIDRTTLAHELVHALQDQHFGLDADGETQDQQLANRGITEGDARYVDILYENRCEGEWRCIPPPDSGDGGGGSAGADYNRGLFLTIYTPYAAGSQFVDQVRAQSGWDGVNQLYDARPESTEQLIHPQLYPDEDPVEVTVPDRSNGEWRRFDVDPVADTVGEASIYAMFVHNDVVDPENRYGYESEPSAGWGGDSVVPYTNGTAGGYVWETAWDSERDARQFHEAYLDVLDSHDARNPRGNVYVVPDGEFADAFRAVRSGDTVRIVNAPTVDGLDAVHSRSG
ncbi:Hvo_1808 family surface protein [Halosimplex halophilum]|uniref:Hvo_1808 family surface protein n=1 Tax=Halosimplex halophilum TaxID=2559572 RepID=UPI001435455C|nr:Hvo_1808 family surface protein [Halosimplex halophilum]